MKDGFGSEPAADVGRYDADARFAPAKHVDQNRLGAMRHLRACPHRQDIIVVEAGNDAPRLDRMTAAFVQMEAFLDAMSRLPEGGIAIAVFDDMLGDEIIRAFQPGLGGCLGNAIARIQHRW